MIGRHNRRQEAMSSLGPIVGRENDVRATLAAHLPWSPHDGVPGVSAAGDRALYANQLTRPLKPSDDLRFIYRADDREALALFAERLPWDSDFFGYEVAKLQGIFPLKPPLFRPFADFAAGLGHFLRAVRERDIRYLLALVDTRDLAAIR